MMRQALVRASGGLGGSAKDRHPTVFLKMEMVTITPKTLRESVQDADTSLGNGR